MKYFSILCLLLFFSNYSLAGNLNEALDQEASLLAAEVQELQRARLALKNQHIQEMAALNADFLKTQAELIAIQGQNQKLSDQYQSLRSEFNNQQKIDERVESSWERLYKVLLDKRELYELTQGTPNRVGWGEYKTGSEYVDFNKKREIVDGIFRILAKSNSTEIQTVNFLKDEELLSSQIFRVGLLGAQLKDSKLPLAPVSDGVLSQQFEKAQIGAQGIFIFKDLNKSSVKVDAGLWDRVVSFFPAIFLVMLFIIVFGLFGLFVRE